MGVAIALSRRLAVTWAPHSNSRGCGFLVFEIVLRANLLARCQCIGAIPAFAQPKLLVLLA
jgi:hypothetical protein